MYSVTNAVRSSPKRVNFLAASLRSVFPATIIYFFISAILFSSPYFLHIGFYFFSVYTILKHRPISHTESPRRTVTLVFHMRTASCGLAASTLVAPKTSTIRSIRAGVLLDILLIHAILFLSIYDTLSSRSLTSLVLSLDVGEELNK